MLRITKNGRRATILEKLGDLIIMQGGVEWNGSAARGNDSQISRDPARVVIGENGKPRSAGELVFSNPPAHRLGHAVKFGIRAALHVVVALQFQCDVIGPALGALDEAIVEGGHWSWR